MLRNVRLCNEALPVLPQYQVLLSAHERLTQGSHLQRPHVLRRIYHSCPDWNLLSGCASVKEHHNHSSHSNAQSTYALSHADFLHGAQPLALSRFRFYCRLDLKYQKAPLDFHSTLLTPVYHDHHRQASVRRMALHLQEAVKISGLLPKYLVSTRPLFSPIPVHLHRMLWVFLRIYQQ